MGTQHDTCFLNVSGANGLADPRHFLHPTASFEQRACAFTLVQKFLGELFAAPMDHSCFDVVAWHGNYVPYKYDMSLFCVVNSVLFDHLVCSCAFFL
jgi:homogentisate 1,2-dioxygenase